MSTYDDSTRRRCDMRIDEFILARVTEDEVVASEQRHGVDDAGLQGPQAHSLSCGYNVVEFGDDCVCGWPTRVLAQCAALRAVVPEHDCMASTEVAYWMCTTCVDWDVPTYKFGHSSLDFEGGKVVSQSSDYHDIQPGAEWPCLTLRHLASIWSDHPDFDPAWASERKMVS